MLASDSASAARTWRPQLHGDRRASAIDDPVIEPLWTGPRVLVFVHDGAVEVSETTGQPVAGYEDLRAALVEATAGATVLLEAFLTPEPIQGPAAIAGRDIVSMPKPGQAMTQMIVGTRGERKARLERQQEEARQRTIEGTQDGVALVVVDLLWLDDESLCDVPLLERKRLLESVVEERYLVRVGIHVKPPIDAWLGSWRTFGFRRLSYKAANSRYLPGQKNQDWALAEIPPR
jgi:hypothetical protein